MSMRGAEIAGNGNQAIKPTDPVSYPPLTLMGVK